MITLVLGGARSGKSRHAEGLAAASAGERIYIATAENIDTEMAGRIAKHREQRGPGWCTVEAPYALEQALLAADGPERFLLIECITLWINNLLYVGADVEERVATLCTALQTLKADVVLVSNEAGLGIVPDNALARAFRDAAGRANQVIAAAAGEVVFIVAGLPLVLKTSRPG